MAPLRTVLLLLTTACWCAGCSDRAVPAPESTVYEQRARDTLQLLRTDYDSLQLWRALDRARWLGTYLAAQPDSTAPAVQAEAYQYLAMLHYDRRLTTDSIAHYTRAAQEALPADASVRLRARQALCNAYVAYYQWAWLEVDMFCAYGKELLRAQRQEENLLYAALLSVQGVARKQQGLTLRVTAERDRVWRQALSVLSDAYRILATRESPWRFIVLEDIKLLAARMDEKTLAPFTWLLPPLDTVQHYAGYVNEDRYRGNVHYLAGHADSTIYYYNRVRERGPYFRTVNVEEAMVLTRESYVQTSQFEAALRVSEDILAHLNCCPEEATYSPACVRSIYCSFDLSDAAETLLERYRVKGEEQDLRAAHQLAQRSIDRYREALSAASEESTFNRLNTLGERLIDRAVTATRLMLRHHPSDGLRDTLLYTMEVGKAHLLTAELQATAVQSLTGSNREIRNTIARLKEEYGRHLRLPPGKLKQFVRLAARRGSVQVRYPEYVQAGAALSVAAVRGRLAPEQALVAFTEVGDSILSLYIDYDTAMVSMVYLDRGAVRQLVNDLSGNLREHFEPSLATRLYEVLLGSFDAILRQRSELLIIPSVDLAELPFVVLRPPGGEDYLIERHTVRYLESWRAHLHLTGAAAFTEMPTAPRIGIWTHPDLAAYFTPITRFFRQLPELRVAYYEGEACTTENYLRQSPAYDWLQLSVHARGNAQLLNDNYIFLNTHDSLSGQQVATQPLATRMVVLAACSGSEGFRSRMEGTLSLRRSFKRAGVPYVVASLYDIPAAASAALLREFYHQLLARGRSPEQALALAQRRCLRGQLGKQWQQPYAWAGLVVS